MTGCNEANADLKQAQTELACQVASLSRRVISIGQSTSREIAALRTFQSTVDDSSYQRLLLFAKTNASKLLRTPHPDLVSASKTHCHAARTVRQSMLRSKASDCTLQDFRLLVRFFRERASIKCRAYPSEFYVFSTDAGTAERFDIIFDTFFDLCHALQISANVREIGAYREKKVQAEIRAVQVSGTVRYGLGVGAARARHILLGQSGASQSADHCVYVMSQANTAWSEHTWDSPFELRSTTLQSIISTTTQGNCVEKPRTSDLNLLPPQRYSFRLTWERNIDAQRYPEMPPSMAAGSIRTYFPVVSIGTRILTDSVQQIFTSRTDGKLLKELLISP